MTTSELLSGGTSNERENGSLRFFVRRGAGRGRIILGFSVEMQGPNETLQSQTLRLVAGLMSSG